MAYESYSKRPLVEERHWPLIALAVLVTFFLASTAVNREWLYPNPGFLDEWYYVSYGFNFDDPSFLPTYYKVSRLPWILANVLFFDVFTPAVAQYLLQTICILSAAVLTFIAVRRLLNENAAIVAAGLLIVYTHFHASGGASYHNTLAGPLYAATFMATSFAALSYRDIRWSFAAGALFGLTVHTNITFINMTPPLLIHFLVCRHAAEGAISFPLTLRTALIGFLGAVVATVLLGLASLSFGRQFLFFLPLFNTATAYIADSTKSLVWWQPWSGGWYLHARYLGPLLVVALASGFGIVHGWKRADGKRKIAIGLLAQYVLLVTIWIIWQSLGQVSLNFDYFAYPLILPMVLAIAGLVAIFGTQHDQRFPVALAILLGVSGLLPYWLSVNLPKISLANLGGYPVVVGLLGFAVGLGVLILFGRNRSGLLITACALGLTCASNSISFNTRTWSACTYRLDTFLAIIHAHEHILATGIPNANTFVWFDDDEILNVENCGVTRLHPIGFSLTSMGFYYLETPWPMKSIDELNLENLANVSANDPLIAFITNEDANLDRLIRRFDEAGAKFSVYETIRLANGSVHFELHLLRRS